MAGRVAARHWLAAALISVSSSAASAHDDFYSATVLTCHDGDTCRVTIDLGLGFALNNLSIRLYGLDAPEVTGTDRPAGIVSRDWLRAQIVGREVVLETHGRGKYGRLLATIWIDGRDVNAEMIERGLAVPYDGGAR